MLQELRFHHIGITCHDIDKSKTFYELMGYKATPTIDDPMQHSRISFLTKEEMPTVELIAPIDETSPVNRILQEQGVSPYHICYEVAQIEQAMAMLWKGLKLTLVAKPTPACALGDRRVAFMFHKNVGLIELVEMGM